MAYVPVPKDLSKIKTKLAFNLTKRCLLYTSYNDLCRGCTHSCKQSFRAVIILCPRYYSKRRKKEDRDNGR